VPLSSTSTSDYSETTQREPLPALKPRALKAGDRVAVLSPASRPESQGALRRCIQVVEQMGFKAEVGKSAMNMHGFMAGTDEERLADFNCALADETIAAVCCTTGGFGTLHLLPGINYEALRRFPKVITGCDDNTSLLNAITAKTGLVTFHAPNLDQVKTRTTFERMKNMLTSTAVPGPITTLSGTTGSGGNGAAHSEDLQFDAFSPVQGNVQGTLAGGNLTAFISLLGTPYEPAVKGSILFFEDRNEQNGILDRWMTTLYIGGFLQAASGVAFGAFENCDPKGSANMLSVEDTFGDRLRMLNKVSCFGLPFGQTKNTNVVPLNIKATLNTHESRLEFAESPLSS
jgi:muramoyltetrapeptide carboxypeptidase